MLVRQARFRGGSAPGVGIREEELGLVRGRIAGELAHDAPESLGGLGVALLLVVPLGDLELRVRREGARGIFLDQGLEHFGALRRLPEPVERELGPALGLARRRAPRILLLGLREPRERCRVVSGVVLALRQPERGECRHVRRGKVLEEPRVAALRFRVALRREVEVSRAGPGPLRDGRAGAVAHHGFPLVHGVSGAVQPRVAESRLIAGRETVRMVGVPLQEHLVGRRGVPVALLIEAIAGDVEERAAHDRRVPGRAEHGDEPLLGGDGEAVATLAGVRPRQELRGRGADRVSGEITREPLERGLGLRVAALGGGRVGVDQKGPRAPRRSARRHALEHEMRRARELPDVARLVVGVLEKAERRVHQLPQLRRREGERRGGGVASRRVPVEHDLEIGRRSHGTVLREETYTREIRGRRSFGLERIA